MSDTASSIPDWGTGSGVLMSRWMTVRMGLVRSAFVVVRKATRASFVKFVAVILIVFVWICKKRDGCVVVVL